MNNEDKIYIIKANSGNFMAKDQIVQIYDRYLIYNDTIIDFSEVKDIHLSNYNPKDWNKYGLIVFNIIIGSIVSVLLSLSIVYTIVLLATLVFSSIIIVKQSSKNIYSFVSISIENTEYLIGVPKESDAKTLFNLVQPHLSKDITYDEFNEIQE